MNSILLLGSSSFTTGLRSQVRGLTSLTVTVTETANEAISLIERLSPDIVIAQTNALKESSIIKTFGRSQSAYVIVIDIEQPPSASEQALEPSRKEDFTTHHLDKTAYALESGADAYLWLPPQNQFAAKDAIVPLELVPVATSYKRQQQQAQTRPSIVFQPSQCRLIQAHIQIGLGRAQRYRDLSRINDWLSAVALVDALTQINNRRAFDLELPNQLKMARQKKTPLSLMVLDIDFFKSVNDRYGHLVGDDMLKQLAKRLLANMRFYDTPYRYGGEEFVITLNNTDAKEGKLIANRLRQLIADAPFQLTQPVNDITALEITVSIGLTELQPTDDEQGRSFLDRADKNLLQAKESGRNQVVAI